MSVMSKPVALITGAGRGIGRAVAIELSRRGYAMVLVARTESDLEHTKELTADACAFTSDIAKPQAAKDAVQLCLSEFGRIDAIVHCAGLAPILKIDETTDEQWHAIIDTNLSAAFYLARAAWGMFAKQKYGVIVNISSLAARDPFVGFTAYGAAKAGINLLGLTLAREGQSHGIRVHTVAPGATETQMFRKLMTPEQFSPDKTLDPSDVARVVAQCVTGELAHTSGEVIWVHKTV
jgi:NAD(P)-dependent dehydrogenase (short-subunit alcohol dehydrogenase family)